ncbi:alpha-tocopherol transfer protein [Bombyx mori]|uniref:CRAL-TRIO domain-containing protein n=1 Tax=Bombyx mori TaxID=7091 RepID=A0A8R2R5Y9_BOMMO|nr:alpha-tocopherol transfer protein-like [Bombyx mori]
MSEIISAIDLFEISEISPIITEGYSMRIKGIHLITTSKLVEIIIGIFRKALGTKVGNRIHVHADLESLHKHVSKDVLPVELGGSEGSLVKLHDQRIEVFTSKENLEYFERVSKFGTEEKYRPKGQFSELHMGMTGSFRNLRVD